MGSLVIYQGIPCKLLVAEGVFPTRLQFSCWGYPNEIMKEVTPEELECLLHFGRFPLN